MANLDVSFLMVDPDFADSLILIRRSVFINQYGESIITETQSNIIAVVQTGRVDSFDRLPESARLSDSIEVYYRGVLFSESPLNGYADILVWQGRRYQVKMLDEKLDNYGQGFVKALCIQEEVNNG